MTNEVGSAGRPQQNAAMRRKGGIFALAGIAVAAFGMIAWTTTTGIGWQPFFIFAGLGIALYGWLQLRKSRRA
ncbi:MAG TPA: hypothetical protein ENN51_03550 [candidate division WOR-3 bacterium]|uniref:Uncharacterized protein n=1 Tax=candidate division WOR-3 bacterium TaxID=2052148 RepID=A0A7V0T547_UNCW3|nr:hypothetical protein [candidate division WOR-3 bacterium]